MVVKVIGGGLAGCEACYQLLKRGYSVELYEMRKVKMTPAHHTTRLAELVCSNSLKSMLEDTASGCLKGEMELLDCMLLRAANIASVPAGGALAVDRELFSKAVEEELTKFHKFTRIDMEVENIDIDQYTIIATGPLTSDTLSKAIGKLLHKEQSMYFYDAAAPIIAGDSIDYSKAFFAARYDKGESDYLNCGMTKEEYLAFYNAIINAEQAPMKDFDRREYFEGCMPIEVLAKRGEDTIRYGMLKPKGIVNPNNGQRYYAVVQLRKENTQGDAYNLVGFQTNLKFPEQRRVFGLIPALQDAEYLRYGVMHRNTYLNAPQSLKATMQTIEHDKVYFAGQITGVEGYVESIASGLIAALNMAGRLENKTEFVAPNTTIIGSLQRHICNTNVDFQPMNANFGILPPLDTTDGKIKDKKERKRRYFMRSIKDMQEYIASHELFK